MEPPPLELGEPQLRAAAAAGRVHQLDQSPSDVEREERGRGGLAREEDGRVAGLEVPPDLGAREVDAGAAVADGLAHAAPSVTTDRYGPGVAAPAFAALAASVPPSRRRSPPRFDSRAVPPCAALCRACVPAFGTPPLLGCLLSPPPGRSRPCRRDLSRSRRAAGYLGGWVGQGQW